MSSETSLCACVAVISGSQETTSLPKCALILNAKALTGTGKEEEKLVRRKVVNNSVYQGHWGQGRFLYEQK